MGREIKRVALDFEYPINKMIWKGYANPYSGLKCEACDGSGGSPEYKRLSDNWYTHLRIDGKEGWGKTLDQDDVQALVDDGRLWDFTRVPVNDEQREVVRKKIADGGNSWLPYDNGVIPTAEEVNEWAKKGMGHDSINHWVCTKARAARVGITETICPTCNGEGVLWADDKYKQLAEDFEWIDPPSGDGYQLWTTTTEGTPMSPVFAKPEDLAKWLADTGASSFGRDTATYDEWLKFINGPAWAVSMVVDSNGVHTGLEASIGKE